MSDKLKATGKGQSESELTKLKALWRGLAEDAREYWRSRFVSDASQELTRSDLLKKLKINLRWDSQLTNFRKWVQRQDEEDEEYEKQVDDERRLKEEHPDWTDDQRRQHVIKLSLNRAVATGKLETLGLKAVRAGQNEKVIALDTEKFKEGLRTKLETGLDQLSQHIKGNAAAKAAFDAFKATIADSTK